MKKNYVLIIMLFFAFLTNAQVTVQGIYRDDIKQSTTQKQLKKSVVNTSSFNDIQYWVGTGA
ncbi:MAG: hypothetical protein WAM46_15690, partial [Flavobacterium sp.]